MENQAHYLIVGAGRTSKHMQNYLGLLGLSFDSWDRSQEVSELRTKANQATHVLLLISDTAIEGFYREYFLNSPQKLVHFSGALEIPEMLSAHPLMTFAKDLYSLDDYKLIPFVTISKLPFSEILPGFPNSHYQLRPDQKPLYHALCVLSGNFTNLLWQKMSSGLKSLGLPPEIFHPYLNKITFNILQDSENSLTGPLARKDLKTVIENDHALNGDPFQKIYRAFVEVYYPEALRELQK